MRYLIAENKLPEQFGDDFLSLWGDVLHLGEFSHTHYCGECGTELYGVARWVIKPLMKYEGKWNDRQSLDAKKARLDIHCSDYKANLKKIEDAISEFEELVEIAHGTFEAAKETYMKTVDIDRCPVCGAALRKEKGYFMPASNHAGKAECLKYYDPDPELKNPLLSYPKSVDDKFKYMKEVRKWIEPEEAKKLAEDFVRSSDLPVAAASSKAENIRNSQAELKKYVLTLLQLENNLYSLGEQLDALYYQRLGNSRNVVFERHEPAYRIKLELQELKSAYQKALEAVKEAEEYKPKVSVKYPTKPDAPVLGKPGLFNKKKVEAENEALTAKYQTALEEYRREVQRCDDEKLRLIAEKREVAIAKAQKDADVAKVTLDKAEASTEKVTKEMADRVSPTNAIRELIAKEIADTEELLKKTLAARNELYAYDIIFVKYRNAVALSSFYEYLSSGRCTTLEGADGAYNIYENEIRLNLVISQLDTVIASLEDIKQNQYMMYQEMRNINASLQRLNSTMDKAFASIQGIEANTSSMNEYMEHISKNSDVIAHNTAVTAYYSKVNAELTNALGYMVAFK